MSVPQCPNCSSNMVMRTSKKDGSKFWGCSQYPDCTGLLPMAKPKPTPPTTKPITNIRLELLKKAVDITITQLKIKSDISVLSALEANLRHLEEVYKGLPKPQEESVEWDVDPEV